LLFRNRWSNGLTESSGKKMIDYISLTFVILAVLLFFDGLIFGVAAAKAVTSIILVVLGLIIASIIGLAIPVLGGAPEVSWVASKI